MNKIIDTLARIPQYFTNTPARYAGARMITIGCGIACAAVAAEAALRVLWSLGKLCQDHNELSTAELSRNLANFVFYGLCALNVLPAIPIVGAAIFGICSIYTVSAAIRADTGKGVFAGTRLLKKTNNNYDKTYYLPRLITSCVVHLFKPIYDKIVIVLEAARVSPNPTWYAAGLLAVTAIALPALGVI